MHQSCTMGVRSGDNSPVNGAPDAVGELVRGRCAGAQLVTLTTSQVGGSTTLPGTEQNSSMARMFKALDSSACTTNAQHQGRRRYQGCGVLPRPTARLTTIDAPRPIWLAEVRIAALQALV